MKVIITGSMSKVSMDVVEAAVDESGFKVDTVISACVSPIDKMGVQWALKHDKKLIYFPLTWHEGYGMRMTDILNCADAVITIWDVSGDCPDIVDAVKRSKAPHYLKLVK